ncbi:MAG: glycosyltransferase, partial [Nitrososphaerota archaeon]
MIRVITFTGMLAGLNAASLHSEYYEEYLQLSKLVDNITVITDNVKIDERFDTERLRILKLPAIRVPKIYGLTKILFYCLAVIKARRKYDIIYVRTFSPPELTALWIGKKLLGVKSIIVLPGTWLFGSPEEKPSLKIKIFRWILRRALYAADRVVLYSWLMLPEVSYYAPNLLRHKDRIVIIRNAVNIHRFRPGIVLEEKYRRIIGHSDYVIYVGRVNEKKGVGDIIRSINSE